MNCNGGGGLLGLVQMDVPISDITTKTLANIPIDTTREVQTLSLRITMGIFI